MNYATIHQFLQYDLEAQDVGKEKQSDAEPCLCEIRPIEVESPQ